MDNDDSAASSTVPEDQPQPQPAEGGAVIETTPEPADSKVVPPTSLLGRAVAELQEAQRTSHDRLLRMAADFENYKKRSRKEQNDAVRKAEEKAALNFLPIIDNLERALSHADANDAGGGLLEGVSMVHKQFLTALERLDIKPFDSVGQPFDPERHEAIQQAASELPPGIVCQEAQRGYCRGDRLVRPALVVVSLGPVSVAPAAPAEQGRVEGGGGDGEAKSNGGEP